MRLIDRVRAWGSAPADKGDWLLFLFLTADLAFVLAAILTELG